MRLLRLKRCSAGPPREPWEHCPPEADLRAPHEKSSSRLAKSFCSGLPSYAVPHVSMMASRFESSSVTLEAWAGPNPNHAHDAVAAWESSQETEAVNQH